MYNNGVRRNALALMANGCSLRSNSMSTGINQATLREWRKNPAWSAPTCEPSAPDALIGLRSRSRMLTTRTCWASTWVTAA